MMTTPTRIGLTVGLIAVVLSAGGAAWAQEGLDETKQVTVEELRAAIRHLADANDLRQANAIFAEVNNHAAKSVQLREVYMRKLMELGHPDKAAGPARMLVRMEGGNALAWALAGFYDANHGEVPDGVAATVTAVELWGRVDDNLAYNLGQAIAWLDIEGAETGYGGQVMADLETRRDSVSQSPSFQDGYDRIKRGEAHYDALVAEAEDEIEGYKEAIDDLMARHAELENEIADVKATIEDLQLRIRRVAGVDAVGVVEALPGSDLGALLRALGEAQARFVQLATEKESVEVKVGVSRARRKETERELRRIHQDKIKAFVQADGWFAFRPPVYDTTQPTLAGIDLNAVSDDDIIYIAVHQEMIETDEGIADGYDEWQEPVATKDIDPLFDEATAADMLRQANIYLDQRKMAEAKALLGEIISTHRKTKSAQKAKRVLAGI